MGKENVTVVDDGITFALLHLGIIFVSVPMIGKEQGNNWSNNCKVQMRRD